MRFGKPKETYEEPIKEKPKAPETVEAIRVPVALSFPDMFNIINDKLDKILIRIEEE